MKKVLLKSFFALIAVVCAFSWSVNANAKAGDFNGDDNVNVGDVSLLYQAILNASTDAAYDLNGDGYVNTGDVSKLYDIILNGGPEEFAQVFILGNTTGDWDPTQGQEMTTTDGVTYTAQLEAVSIDGYAYFGFTTALASQTGDDGWAEISDKRFGAVSEGDFVVTDEMLGVELTLTTEGYQAFKIPTGTYTLTLDLDELTLVIEKEVVEITDLWMIGDFLEGGWAPNNGQKMTYDAENEVFTSTLNVDAVKYFSFTTKLADDADDWDGIAAYRIGAVTEDGTDFWVLEELLGQELALQAGQTAFRVEPGQYTITVDLNKMNIIIDGQITPPAATDVWILGKFGEQEWAPNVGLQMTYDETNQVYTAQMSGNEDMYFSFTTKLAETAEDWDAIAGDRFGAQSEGDFWVTPELLGTELTLTKDNYQAFKLPAGTYTLTLDLDKMNLIIDGEMTPETPADVWVLGKFGEQDWAPNAGLQMTYDETTQKYTAQIAGNEDIYFSFTTKLAETAEDWDAIAGDRFGAISDGDFWVTSEILGTEVTLTKDNYQAFKAPAGEYTLTLDLANLSLVIDGEIAPEPIADLYLISSLNDWDLTAGTQLTYDETNQVYTGTLEAQDDVYFSFTKKLATTHDGWDEIAADRLTPVADSENYWVTAETLGQEAALEVGVKAFYAKAGNYTITVDVANMKAIIDGEIAPEPIADVWVLGKFGEQQWAPNAGLKMTFDETTGKYTAEIAGNEDLYFSFTTKLAETAEDWDAIAGDRFGAVSEGDFVVTAELLEQELSLTKDNYQAFKAPAGEYTLTLDLANMKLVIEGEIAPEPVADLYLISSLNDWDLTAGTKLTYDENNQVYTGTIEAEGDVYFSFTKKLSETADGWDEIAADRVTPVADGENYWVTDETLGEEAALEVGTKAFYAKAGSYIITVDLVNMKAVIDGEIAPEPIADVWVLGQFGEQQWAPNAGLKMTYDETTAKYTAEIAGNEDLYFSFTTKLAETAEDWDGIAGDRFGAVSEGDFVVTAELLEQELSLTKDNYQAFKAPAGEYTLTLDLANMKLVIDGEIAPEPVADVWVLGQFGEQQWAPNAGLKMTYDETTAKYTAEIAGNEDLYFSFTTKLAETAEDWDAIAGDRFGAVSDGDFVVTAELLEQELSLTKDNYQAFKAPAGEYTLTLDLANMKLVIDGEIAPEPVADLYLFDNLNGWDLTAGTKMTYDETTAKYTGSIEADKDVYFVLGKTLANAADGWNDINRVSPQSEGDFWVTSETLNAPITLVDGGNNAFFAKAGEYTITVDLANMQAVITGEIAPEPVTIADVWVLGEPAGGWAPNTGLKMTYDETTAKYTAEFEAVGDAYFSFTTKLAETAEDWDAIAGDRFGAVSNGDFVVTADQLGTTLSLTKDNYQAFKVPAGSYELTLDLENMELVIDGEMTPAPQPTDGYYLLGSFNDWSTSDKTYALTQSTTDPNVYSIQMAVSDDFWFKIAPAAAYEASDFWSTNILCAPTDGSFDLTGTYVENNGGGAWCLPASWNATTINISIDTSNKTWTFVTDGEEPVVSTDYDYLYVAGTMNGWAGSADGPKVASVKDEKNFSGVFAAGTNGEFKFQKDPGSWATNYGGSNGNLASGGANIPANGTVYVTANLNSMQYAVTTITRIGIIGDATPNGWDSDTELTYNSATGAWEGTVTLTAGTIKFRANNGWDINWGGALNNLVENGENISVTAGTYKVSLKLVCKGQYVATLTPA